MRLLVLAGALAALAAPASAQRITVHADRPLHTFEGAGVSFGLFLGHHYSMPATEQDRAVRWIADDLDLSFLQDYPDGETEPADDPGYYDRRADYVKAARVYRPGLEFSLATNKFPSRLRTEITVGGRQYLVLDVDRAGIYDEVAAWYFSLFQAFAERGVSVEILNVVNEPDLDVCGNDPLQCRPYHYGYGDDTQRGVAEVFAQAVPAFLALFDDPAVNTLAMPTPRIMGPSTIAPNGAIDFIQYFKSDRPEAWDAIDIVATHQYINGVRGDLFQTLREEAAGKPLFQSETHGSKSFGPETLAPGHRTALSFSQQFGAAVNFGTQMWAYFETNYPNRADAAFDQFNPGGLISTPFNTTNPARYKHYFAFRQLTSAQPDSSDVLDYTASEGRRADAVVFRKADQDSVTVHYTNTGGTARTITIEVEDAEGVRVLTGYTTRVTDAALDDVVVVDDAPLGDGTAALDVEVGPYAIVTVRLGIGRLITDAEDGVSALLALDPPRPNPTTGAVSVGYRLAAPGAVTVSVFDALGRRVATLAEGDRPAGAHRAETAGLGLAPGLYLVVLDAGGERRTRTLTVVR